MRLSTSLLTDRMPRRTRPAARVPESNPYRRVTEPAVAVDEAMRLDAQRQALFGRRPQFTPVDPRRITAPLASLHRLPKTPEMTAQAFIADKRQLPVFAATTRSAGWQGLHMPSRPVVHQVWTVERWHAQALSVIASAADAAMAEVDERISAAQARLADGGRHRAPAPAARREGWLREALAEALWGAHRWYTGRDEGRALIYEGLHDIVISALDDADALAAVRTSIAAGMADADDLTGPSGILAEALAAGGER